MEKGGKNEDGWIKKKSNNHMKVGVDNKKRKFDVYNDTKKKVKDEELAFMMNKNKKAKTPVETKKKNETQEIPKQLNKTNQKSKFRYVIESEFPMGFTSILNANNQSLETLNMLKQLDENKKNDTLYIEDIMQPLKSFGGAYRKDEEQLQYISTPEKLAAALLKNVNYCMDKTEGESTIHCLIFDKYRHVPITKGAEHAKRNSQQVKEIKHDPKKPYFVRGKTIPKDWNDAKSDREGRLSSAINFICKTWITPDDSRSSIKPLLGKRVFIDGHHLSYEDMNEMGVYGLETVQKKLGYTDEQMKKVDFRDIPLCVEVPNEQDKTTDISIGHDLKERKPYIRLVYIVPELYNKLGEGDFTIFWFIRMMTTSANHNLKTRIFSVDTDVIPFTLSYMHRWYTDTNVYKNRRINQRIHNTQMNKPVTNQQQFSYLPEITWQFEPKPSWVFGPKKEPTHKEIRVLDMKQLYLDMEKGNFYRMSNTEKKKLENKMIQQGMMKSKKKPKKLKDDTNTSLDIDIKKQIPTTTTPLTTTVKQNIKKHSIGKEEIVDDFDLFDDIENTPPPLEKHIKIKKEQKIDKTKVEDIDDDDDDEDEEDTKKGDIKKKKKRVKMKKSNPKLVESTDIISVSKNKVFLRQSKSVVEDIEDFNSDIDDVLQVSTRTSEANERLKENYLLKHKPMAYVVAYILGGTDYNESFKGITHRHIIDALIYQSNYIGDLVTFSNSETKFNSDITISGSAYIRLLKSAYMYSKSKLFGDTFNPALITFDMILEKTSHLSTENLFSNLDVLEFTLKHAIYMMKMVYQVGNPQLVFSGYPDDYGYAKIDKSIPYWSRDNTMRVFS